MAFNAIRILPHAQVKNIYQGHRLVVLPDYQGLGIGWRFDEWMGAHLHRKGLRYHNTTSHPAMIAAFSKSPRWRNLGRGSDLNTRTTQPGLRKQQTDVRRLGTQSFAYAPPHELPEWMTLDTIEVVSWKHLQRRIDSATSRARSTPRADKGPYVVAKDA